jgi:hypothetical protein
MKRLTVTICTVLMCSVVHRPLQACSMGLGHTSQACVSAVRVVAVNCFRPVAIPVNCSDVTLRFYGVTAWPADWTHPRR